MIANDMLAIFNRLPSEDRVTIRQVAEMRFARDFANGAFADYLEEDDKGQISLRRLPAEDDPMLNRVRGLRQRHYVFVDTLQGHYSGFAEDMYSPYQEWRKASYEETVALRELESEAQREMIAGGAAILAGVLAQTSGSRTTRSAGAVGVLGRRWRFAQKRPGETRRIQYSLTGTGRTGAIVRRRNHAEGDRA